MWWNNWMSRNGKKSFASVRLRCSQKLFPSGRNASWCIPERNSTEKSYRNSRWIRNRCRSRNSSHGRKRKTSTDNWCTGWRHQKRNPVNRFFWWRRNRQQDDYKLYHFRCVLDTCYADLQCCWQVDSAVLQKNQGRSGSCFWSTDYNCKRPCCSCHLLWYELDFASEHLEVGVMIFYDSQIQG